MTYALISAWSAVLLILLGCAAGPEPGEILERSRDAMAEVQSYRTSSEFESELSDGVMGGRQSTKWAAPERWYMKVEFEGHGSERPDRAIEAIVIGDQAFNRELDSDEQPWRETTIPPVLYTAYNMAPDSYLSTPDLDNLRLEGEAIIDGTATFQIAAEGIETRPLPERFPPGPSGDDIEIVSAFTWFIAKDDYLLVRYSVEQDTALGRFTHRTTMDFFDYNAPVSIEAPDTAQ